MVNLKQTLANFFHPIEIHMDDRKYIPCEFCGNDAAHYYRVAGSELFHGYDYIDRVSPYSRDILISFCAECNNKAFNGEKNVS